MKSSFVMILCGVLLLVLSGCGHLPERSNLSPRDRLLILCEGWESVFSRVDIRDQVGFATKAEVKAVDEALPILNPICTQAPADAVDFDIVDLEQVLLTVILAAEEN